MTDEMQKIKMTLDFDGKEDETRHRCTYQRDGEWIIWTCTCCPHKWIHNYVTGESHREHGPDPNIDHYGSFMPPALGFVEDKDCAFKR